VLVQNAHGKEDTADGGARQRDIARQREAHGREGLTAKGSVFAV
jgi:hypothetical protein